MNTGHICILVYLTIRFDPRAAFIVFLEWHIPRLKSLLQQCRLSNWAGILNVGLILHPLLNLEKYFARKSFLHWLLALSPPCFVLSCRGPWPIQLAACHIASLTWRQLSKAGQMRNMLRKNLVCCNTVAQALRFLSSSCQTQLQLLPIRVKAEYAMPRSILTKLLYHPLLWAYSAVYIYEYNSFTQGPSNPICFFKKIPWQQMKSRSHAATDEEFDFPTFSRCCEVFFLSSTRLVDRKEKHTQTDKVWKVNAIYTGCSKSHCRCLSTLFTVYLDYAIFKL
jgi:hypothetical protein